MQLHRLLLMTTAALFCVPTLANNGAITFEFEFPVVNSFTSCLNESVSGTIYVTATYHEFDTPSGTHHYLENWEMRYEFVGDSTLREWIGKGVSPARGSLMKNGEKFSFTEKGQLNPVHVDGIEDGPKWRYNKVSQWRWDENGVLTREFSRFANGDIRCLGSN